MIIVFGFLVVLVAVRLLGGDLRRALDVPLRAQWLVILALVVQTVITTWAADRVGGWIGDVLHMGTYALAAVFFMLNRRVPGLWIVAVGGAMNLAAIAANGGVMPASRWAVETAGISVRPDEFANSQALANPRLLPLGDVFAVPAGWPFANVFSIGDVVLLIGAFIVFRRACGGRRLPIDTVGAMARR